MDGLMSAVLESTTAKVAATYYVVAACGLFGLLGQLSSPNPKLKKVTLRDLESTASGSSTPPRQQPQQQSSASSSSSAAPMKRKLVRG
jgi:hypothetical protein